MSSSAATQIRPMKSMVEPAIYLRLMSWWSMSLGSAKISDSLCGLSTLILAKDRHIQGRALAVSAVTADVRIQICPICCGMSVLRTLGMAQMAPIKMGI